MPDRVTDHHASSAAADTTRHTAQSAETARQKWSNEIHRNRIGIAASILFWTMLLTAVAMVVQLSFYQFQARTASRAVHIFISRSALGTQSFAIIGLLCGVWLLTVRHRSTFGKALAWMMRMAALALVICTLWQWRGYPSTTPWSSGPLQNIQPFALVTLFSVMIIYCGRNWRELFSQRFVETLQIAALFLLFVLAALTIGAAWRGIGPRAWVWLPFPAIAELAHSVLLIVGAVLAFRIRNAVKQINREGKCPMCMYNLQGNPQWGCPECGWKRSTSIS